MEPHLPHYHHALSAGGIGIWEYDLRDKRLTWSAAMANLYSIRPEDAPQSVEDWLAMVQPADREALRRAMDVTCFPDEQNRCTYRVLREGGATRWLEDHIVCIRDDTGEPIALAGMTRDVTGRVEGNRTRRELRAQLHALFDHSPFNVWVCDMDGRYILQNQAAREQWGDYIGKLPSEVSLPDQLSEVWSRVNQRALAGEAVNEEVVYTSHGEKRWVVNIAAPIIDDEVQIGIVGVGFDITDRKRMEDRLQRQTNVLEQTQRIAKVGGWEYVVATESLYWTAETYRIHEVTPDAVTPEVTTGLSYYTEASAPIIRKAFQSLVEQGEPFDLELQIKTAKGNLLWVRVTGHAIKQNDKVVRVYGAFQDITEHKQLTLYRERLLDVVLDLVCIMDTRGYYRLLNPAFESILGYTTDELLQRPIVDYLHPEDRQRTLDALATLSRGRNLIDFENRYVCSNGAVRWLQWRATMVMDGFIYASARDVTDRKQEELRQRLLVSELDHRVKNNLAAVLAIAQQTISHVKTLDDFAPAFIGRIKAMAHSHQILSANQWHGVSLSSAVEQVLRAFTHSQADRLIIEGEPIDLPAHVAMPVSLVLHELATNAAKYGSLSVAHGRIAVSWRADHNHRLHFDWLEIDGPVVTPPDNMGLGTQLIYGLIQYEMQGEVSITFEPTGLSCSLIVPLKPPRSRTDAPMSFDPSV